MSLSIIDQDALLRRCVSEGLDLDKELSERGLSYDDLRYRRNELSSELFPNHSLSGEPLQLEDCIHHTHGVPTVSFFAGCGGLDIGFDYAGFHNLASIEINATFCQTLRENNPGWLVVGPPDYSGDARNREEIVTVLHRELGLAKGRFPGVFHGGPPCQSFSVAANQRFSMKGDNFKRIGFSQADYGTLLLDFVFYISVFRPEVFLIENVPGLLTVDGGEQVVHALAKLQAVGYNIISPVIINAADYEVPQNRLRVFVVGHRRSRVAFSVPSPTRTKVPCERVLQTPIGDAENHITRKHKAESIIRYMELDFGEREQLGRVDRLEPRLPSKTVIAGGSNGGGRSHLHPYIPRTLSVRECARLQTFPDSYVFMGSAARQFTQVGNAVPPLLAYRLAESIYEQLFI